MKEQTFRRLMTAVLVLGLISVIVLVLITYHLFSECSILSYIANRG